MQGKTARWGNSLAVRLPKEVVERLQIREGEPVRFALGLDSVSVTPIRQRRIPTLDEMVAEMRRLGPDFEPPTVDWGPDVGEEIINDGGYPEP